MSRFIRLFLKQKKTVGSAEHETHREERSRTGFCREGGYSASEVPVAKREAIDTEDTVFKLSLGSQANSAHLMPINSKAKGKGKARASPRAGPTLNRAQSANGDGDEGTLKRRDNPPKKRGSATNINRKAGPETRPETRRVQSRDKLRRIRSAKVLRLPRGGQVVTKKRHANEQSAGSQQGPSNGPSNDP